MLWTICCCDEPRVLAHDLSVDAACDWDAQRRLIFAAENVTGSTAEFVEIRNMSEGRKNASIWLANTCALFFYAAGTSLSTARTVLSRSSRVKGFARNGTSGGGAFNANPEIEIIFSAGRWARSC